MCYLCGVCSDQQFIAIDLDANNRHMHPDGSDFGWGVCRHGHGLQNFGKLDQLQAERIAEVLNEGETT